MLLGGRYEKVFEMCKGRGPLGWSSGENPKPVFVTFMMVVLSKEEEVFSKILYKQMEDALGNTSYSVSREYVEKFRKIVDVTKKSIKLTREQEAFYLKWCKDEIGKRVDAIVSNQHRGAIIKQRDCWLQWLRLWRTGEKSRRVWT